MMTIIEITWPDGHYERVNVCNLLVETAYTQEARTAKIEEFESVCGTYNANSSEVPEVAVTLMSRLHEIFPETFEGREEVSSIRLFMAY